jgi:hypothetical protein
MLADVRVESFATKAPSACADQCPLLPPKDIRKITGVKKKDRLAAISPKSNQVF